MNHHAVLQKVPTPIKRALHPLRRRLFLVDYVLPEHSVVRSWVDYMPNQRDRQSTAITNLRVLAPAETVTIGAPDQDPFIPVGKYYRSGSFDRPSIFVCDIPNARLHIGSGMVCTRDWEVVSELEYRLEGCPPFRRRRPAQLVRRSGKCSTVFFWNAGNIGHWWMDCLPRVHSLAKVEPSAELTLLMPSSLGTVHRESLEYILPPNFRVEYLPDNSWLQLDNLPWASMVSGRCNFLLPAEYYEAIRRPIFTRFGLPVRHQQTARIYISRRHAKHRRVLNDEEVCRLLTRYGFDCVDMEKYSFRQQVELFHRADIVIGPHGAGLTSILFSGPIRLVVFYATQAPQNHYHTLAKGLGQEFHFLTDARGEEDDFTVDLPALEKLLREQLGLLPL